MNVAQKQTETQVPQKHKIITDFYERYEQAVEQARLSAVTTDTDRWKAIYAEHRRDLIKARKSIASELQTYTEQLEQHGWGEATEKAVKELIKSAVELREAEHHWRRQTLDKMTAAVEQCESVRRNAMKDASAFAVNQPMFGQQVADELRKVMALLPVVSFDEDTGRVLVVDPS
jgi:hypothetical protein